MYGVAAPIRNDIARTQQIKSPTLRNLMALPQEQLTEALDRQADLLEQSGASPDVALAFLEMAPLLSENMAISRYIQQTGKSCLRSALPEILTAPEAVAVASRDRWLSEPEQAQLLALLQPLEPATIINV